MANEKPQIALLADMTSSKTGTFYFAYGSNLSPTQMALRLRSEQRSSQPVAIARLDAHAWIICARGYANVVRLPATNEATHENTVWGVLYDLSPADEARLDLFEGHDDVRNPQPELNSDPSTQRQVPYLQGDWDYNKHYLPFTVTNWLQDPNQYGIQVPSWSKHHQQPTSIRALIYVDEFRIRPGKIALEYIGRMNRAIRESTALGMPEAWINAIMRKFVPGGIEVDDMGYIGTDKGYVEAEATENELQLKERVLRDTQRQS